MELTERIPLRPIQWLSKLSFSEFVEKYFQLLHNYLEDIDVIRTCYDYFKSIEGMDKFKDIPIPETEHQNNLKELSRNPIEQWLESFTRENCHKGNIELLGTEIYERFSKWCIINGVKYETDSQKLGVRLSNMNITGILRGETYYEWKNKIIRYDRIKEIIYNR